MTAQNPRFELGQVVATPGALEALEAAEQDPSALIARHVTGDWGDLEKEDIKANEDSITTGARILSAYVLPETETKIWIITESDRSATTILLSEEY